jgi:rare lipoprotein A
MLLITLIFSACAPKITQTGKASYYADKFNGRKTANGEIFSNSELTGAHKTLPFGTLVKVTNLSNGKSVKVRINDRGPFVAGRMIDLSKKAANKIDMVNAGVGNVKIKYRKKRK